jgi:hypothetical protein
MREYSDLVGTVVAAAALAAAMLLSPWSTRMDMTSVPAATEKNAVGADDGTVASAVNANHMRAAKTDPRY